MAVVQIGHNTQYGVSHTLDATDEHTPLADTGAAAGLINYHIVFNGTWDGTLTFEAGTKINGTLVWDPILATNLVSAATATTTVGATTTDEIWRIDATGLSGIRVYATLVTAGSCTVTPTWAMG
jgi:hypothetical protein